MIEGFKRNATVDEINGLTQKSVGDVYITENGGTVILGKQGRFLVAKGTPLVWRGSYWEILEGYDPKSTYATKEELQSEASQRDASDVALVERIDSIVMDYAKKEYVDTKVSAETTRATAAEASLQTQINGKASQSSLDAETARAEAAESALQTQINGKASQEALADETAARESADTQLQSNIDAETARAQNAETALGERIDGVEDDVESLDTRLTTAESDIDTLESGLSAETEARESADNTLQTNIDNEATARENADNALDARLDEAESDIDNLESAVDSLYNTEVEQTDGETSVSSSTSGKVKKFVVGLASAIKTKIEAAYSHISDAVKHITATERTNWNTAYNHSQTEGNPHGTEIEEIDGLRTELTTIESDVSAIEGVIPSEATTSNKLADKAFVNSSIASQTAYFRGTFDIVDDLGLTHGASNTAIANALASVVSVVTPNDYTFVIDQDTDGNTLYKRFKYSGSVWQYEYTLNNSSFTAAQWAAIQSGITAEDVADIGYNTTARHTHANKNLLDTYTQSNASLADAVAKKHEHANKTILDNTTASYTSEEKTKLDGIESGAEVNVNADWNATSGDAQILNKPSTFPPSSHTHSIGDITGTLPIAKGGTGATTAKAARYNLFNDTNLEDPLYVGDDTLFAGVYINQSTSNGSLYKAKWKYIWSYISNKISSVLGLTSSNYNGKAATAGTADKATAGDVLDTRLTNQTPYWYLTNHPQSVVTEFKQCSTIELTGATYTYLTTITQWRNNSGGEPFQTAQVGSKRYIRYGSNDSTWSAWEELETVSHVSSTYATKSEIPDVSGYETSAHAAATYATNSAVSEGFTNVGNSIQDLYSSKANADGSNASGDWSNITAGKATTDTDGNNIADTFGILNDYCDGLHGARRYINYGTRSWNNSTFLSNAYVGNTTTWDSVSYTGDVTMIEVGDVLVLDVENTSLGSNGKYAHFLLFIKVTAKSTTLPTGVVIACVHSNEQATLDVTNVNANNFIVPGIYNLFGCNTANNWGTNGRTSVIVTAGTNGGAALSTNNAFIEQTMSGTNTRHTRTCSDGTWSSWISSPKTAGVSSSGGASSYTFNGSSSSMFVSYNGTASVSIQVGNLAENILYSIYSCALSSTSRALNISFVKGSLSSNFNLYGHGLNGTSYSSYTLTTTQGSNNGVLHFVRNGNSIYLMEY